MHGQYTLVIATDQGAGVSWLEIPCQTLHKITHGVLTVPFPRSFSRFFSAAVQNILTILIGMTRFATADERIHYSKSELG